MPIGTARVTHMQVVHYFRKRVNFNDSGIAAGIFVGTLPAGAMLVMAAARVNAAFNAATTNVVNFGTTAGGGEILPTATIVPGAAGFKSATTGTAFAASFATDTDIFASYTQTGAAATAGQVDLIVGYIPNNDQ